MEKGIIAGNPLSFKFTDSSAVWSFFQSDPELMYVCEVWSVNLFVYPFSAGSFCGSISSKQAKRLMCKLFCDVKRLAVILQVPLSGSTLTASTLSVISSQQHWAFRRAFSDSLTFAIFDASVNFCYFCRRDGDTSLEALVDFCCWWRSSQVNICCFGPVTIQVLDCLLLLEQPRPESE